nr:MAG TPA: replisome organizer [Caudoviricetes sp.]
MAYSWFRVYNGTINDTKWPRIARDSKQSVGAVVSVWMALLECASMSDDRGSVDDFSPEDIDVLYGYEDGTTDSIFQAMKARGLISPDNRLEAWAKRQSPESGDVGKPSTSTERVRRYRAKRSSKSDETLHETDETLHETDETPYKRREEKNREDNNIKYTPLTPQGEQGVGVSTPAQTSSPMEARETPRPDPEPKPKPEPPAEDTPQAPDTTTAPQADTSHGNPCWKEFCYVFSLWPVQQGKEKAWREYAYLKARHLVPESYALADIIERFKAEDRRWKRGYVPMMANWLRDRRWDDVPEKAPAKSYAPDENGRTPYVNEADQDYSQPSRVGSIMDVMA